MVVQLNDLGPVIQMYQFIEDINDERVPGLESISNYLNENFFNKTDPAVNGHSYYITKAFNTQYNEEHSYNKQQYITNNVNNHVIRPYIITNRYEILEKNIPQRFIIAPIIELTSIMQKITYIKSLII